MHKKSINAEKYRKFREIQKNAEKFRKYSKIQEIQ
jgi:hypothetical protein